MSGDYTRFTFDPRKRYSGVLMQQGRVQLDADWNEGIDILKDRVRKLSLDVYGPVGVPFLVTPHAFEIAVIAGPDLSIGAGRIYVEGWMAENFTPPATYLTQPFLPDPPPLPLGDAIVVLDLWEREVTYIEDPDLLDVALGGVDTATRSQQIWQIHVVPPPEGEGAQCGLDLSALFPPSAGRLTTEAVAPPTPDDPCILPPIAGYRGLENRLYRLEVHDGGALGVARFKWSRDHASIVSAVSAMAVAGVETRLTVNRIGRDQALRFRIDDWVTVTDDHREFHGEPGEMARIIDIDEAAQVIVLDRALPTPGNRLFGALPADLVARRTRVQRWDQNAAVNALDADGLMLTGAGPIDLEDGIRVRLATDPVGGAFHVGDYWVFAARTADASVEILTEAPPRGILHHYAQLAAIVGLGGANDVTDCRPPHQDCACCCVINVAPQGQPGGNFDSLAAAVAALPALAPDPATPVIICLMMGEHPVAAPIALDRQLVTIRGCGLASILVPQTGLISLNADFQTMEDLAIRAETVDPLITFNGSTQLLSRLIAANFGPGAIAVADGAENIVIEDCQLRGSGGVDLAGFGIDIRRNRFHGGPVGISGPAFDVRVWDNRIEESASHGVSLNGESFVAFMDIHRNLILAADRSGIGVGSGDFGPFVIGLTIADNQILDCVGANAPVGVGGLPQGGIVLGRAAELLVRDNRIAENGTAAATAVCGVYVHRSFGVEIARNLISANGRPAGEPVIAGPQAGIYLADARIGVGSVPDPGSPGGAVASVGNVPAARIADNDVDAPRGHALLILGAGPMVAESNRLQCHDILRDPGSAGGGNALANLLGFVGSVVIVNLGLPSFLYSYLLANGFLAVASGNTLSASGLSVPANSLIGGQVQFRGNQVRLDLSRSQAELALANMLIVSLDDIQVADNQSEGILRYNPPQGGAGGAGGATFDFLMADLLAMALTLRQSNNGLFTMPYLTAFSIFSFGWVNHCLGNQTTSCIIANGSAPRSKRRDNAVLFPHPLFCEGAGRGED